MFTSDTQENLSKSVNVDMDYEILNLFVRFIYCEPIDVDLNTVIPLLMAADMYELKNLKNFCEYLLWKNINDKNVCFILSAIHNLNFVNPMMKQDCKDFIRRFVYLPSKYFQIKFYKFIDSLQL
jgi:hypothetical protein